MKVYDASGVQKLTGIGGGGGTVTSVSGGTGVTTSPSPITGVGTVNLVVDYAETVLATQVFGG